jgi:hypothetical protein
MNLEEHQTQLGSLPHIHKYSGWSQAAFPERSCDSSEPGLVRALLGDIDSSDLEQLSGMHLVVLLSLLLAFHLYLVNVEWHPLLAASTSQGGLFEIPPGQLHVAAAQHLLYSFAEGPCLTLQSYV